MQVEQLRQMETPNMVSNQKKFAAVILAGFMSLGASSAYAAGDAANGATLFKANICSACHTTVKGGASAIGPNLFGVSGRKAGGVAGYAYSPAMKASGVTWDDDTLAKYLMAPSIIIRGNKMVFAGIKKQGDADDVVAYLATLN